MVEVKKKCLMEITAFAVMIGMLSSIVITRRERQMLRDHVAAICLSELLPQ